MHPRIRSQTGPFKKKEWPIWVALCALLFLWVVLRFFTGLGNWSNFLLAPAILLQVLLIYIRRPFA